MFANPLSQQVLQCLFTSSALHQASTELIAIVNTAIVTRQVVNAAGIRCSNSVSSGLVNLEETRLYPVIDGVPQMLSETAIDLTEIIPPFPAKT